MVSPAATARLAAGILLALAHSRLQAGSTLADFGVALHASYIADEFGIAAGGFRQGLVYNGLLQTSLDLDLGKFTGLAGWSGATFHINGLYPHGGNGTADYVGDLGTFSNLEAYDTGLLYECWVEQSFAGGRVSIRIGQLGFDSEFATLETYGALFVASGFGVPSALGTNLPIPIFPNAAPGIRLRVEPVNGLTFLAAVFDGNPAPASTPDRSPGAAVATDFNRHGVHWAWRRSEGALVAGEIEYRTPAPGLAGKYEAGFLYATDHDADIGDFTRAQLDPSPGRPLRARGPNFALYANVEQELWREPGSTTQGLGFLAQAAWMPPDRNLVAGSLETGLVYTGLIPGRDKDALGLGVQAIRVSHEVVAAERATGLDISGREGGPTAAEATIELSYSAALSVGWSIQPHVQYIARPGATTAVGNALIVGLRSSLSF